MLGDELGRHWDPERRHLRPTRHRDGGISEKSSGLDSSVVLATLGCYSPKDDQEVEDLYTVDHEQVLATFAVLLKSFESIYPINDPSRHIAGLAIGRYPEDRYDGYRSDSIGNPWPSITIGFAAYCYMLAFRYRNSKRIAISPTNLPFFHALPVESMNLGPGEELASGDPRFDEIVDALRSKGDAFLLRVRCHANPDGSMSEQLNRFTGFQQGAPDLTMNYAAFLLATGVRRRALATPPSRPEW